MPNIRYIKRKDLDIEKWDQCIDSADNGLIYAYSFYLDAMCDNWDGLVLNEYEAVMPLPWRKKWGIAYVYQPPFIQQLGVFCKKYSAKHISLFLYQANMHFRFGEYFLNFDNTVQQVSKTNFIIELNRPYKQVYNSYKTDLRNNLKKARTNALIYKPTFDFEKAILTYKSLYQDKLSNIKSSDFEQLVKLSGILQQKDMLCVRKVTNEKDELLAIALCPKDARRIYLLASSTTSLGRNLKANHFLIDQLIHEFSGTSLIFDFEGSELPGVHHFYQNFGSINQPYFFYRWNNLPWPYRLFKR